MSFYKRKSKDSEEKLSASEQIRIDRQRYAERRQRRGVVIAAAALVLVVTVAIVAASCGFTPSFLNNIPLNSKSEEFDGYEYDSHSDCVFGVLDGGIAVASDAGLQYIGKDGTEEYTELFGLSRPAMRVRGELAAVWDAGDKNVRLFNSSGLQYKLETSEPVISVYLNDRGWYAVTSRESGYKGSVTVYDDSNTGVYKWYVSSAYVTCAAVNETGDMMCAVTLSQNGTDTVSTLHIFALDSEDELADFEIEGEVLVDVGYFSNGSCYAVSEQGVYILSSKGELIGSYDFDGRCLGDFSYNASDNLCVVLSAYGSGTKCDLVSISCRGEINELNTENFISCISSAGDYIAALYEDTLTVYSSNLRVQGSVGELSDIVTIVMLENGSVLLAGNSSARIVTP